MTKNRYLPFGYRIRDGNVVVNEQETNCIRIIFDGYTQGESYSSLADKIQQYGIPYHTDTPLWNKHMVKRILENRRYTGENGYPATVSAEQFEHVQQIRMSKNIVRKPKSAEPKPVFVPPPLIPPLPDIQTARLENQINLMLSMPVMEPERLRELIFQCVAMKYNNCFKAQNQMMDKKADADSARF